MFGWNRNLGIVAVPNPAKHLHSAVKKNLVMTFGHRKASKFLFQLVRFLFQPNTLCTYICCSWVKMVAKDKLTWRPRYQNLDLFCRVCVSFTKMCIVVRFRVLFFFFFFRFASSLLYFSSFPLRRSVFEVWRSLLVTGVCGRGSKKGLVSVHSWRGVFRHFCYHMTCSLCHLFLSKNSRILIG